MLACARVQLPLPYIGKVTEATASTSTTTASSIEWFRYERSSVPMLP